MSFTLKKRTPSKSRVVSNGHDDSKALSAVLHDSTKTKSKKKKHQQLLESKERTPSSDFTPSLPKENGIIYRNQCSCDIHYNKQLIEHSYALTVDRLYDLIFGSNEFVRTYRQAQRFYDETVTDWLFNDATNHDERTLKYKVPYESTFIGKSTILTREKQILYVKEPGSHYMLEAEVYNEGVKFSDTFSLILRYCLVQTSATTTNLRVTAHIIYNKSVNGFIKQLIERNAYSASQEGLKDLNNRLNLIQNFQMTPEKNRLSQTDIPIVIPTPEFIRRISQHDLSPRRQSLSNNIRSSDSDRLMHIVIFLVIILSIVQIYLYTKLKQTDLLLGKLAELLKI